MNKAGLIAAVVEKAELSRRDVRRAAKAFTDTVSEELVKDGKVRSVGFGTFEVSEKAAGEGKDPKTGKTMTIEASKTPKFRAGKALKDEVNK